MKEKRSLLLIFLLVMTPLVTIAFIPVHLWVLLNIVLFTVVVAMSYNMERPEHSAGPFTQFGFVACVICLETLLWGCANYIIANPAISSAGLWQPIVALFASSVVAITAFVTLGKRLLLQQEN